MKKVSDLFVPYELALKLKEKGFNEPCFAAYSQGGGSFTYHPAPNDNGYNNSKIGFAISKPLYQQVIDWLEEEKGLEINAYKVLPVDIIPVWVVRIINWTKDGKLGFADKFVNHGDSQRPINHFYTKKEALDKAIDEALNLIP